MQRFHSRQVPLSPHYKRVVQTNFVLVCRQLNSMSRLFAFENACVLTASPGLQAGTRCAAERRRFTTLWLNIRVMPVSVHVQVWNLARPSISRSLEDRGGGGRDADRDQRRCLPCHACPHVMQCQHAVMHLSHAIPFPLSLRDDQQNSRGEGRVTFFGR